MAVHDRRSLVVVSAGLGGGMGVFLGGPIVDELKDCVGATDVPASARRVLEVMVPLVYRPAMKVRAFSIASVHTKLLNKLLGSEVTRRLIAWIYDVHEDLQCGSATNART